jgi:general secretion pathway protein A
LSGIQGVRALRYALVEESITPFADSSSGDPECLTYEVHFGLREKPFSLSPNPRFFFRNSSHAQAFDALIAGIRRREGILALTGEVGTGKTTLCRTVSESLDRKTFAAFVPDPILSREDLLKTLLVDFGVVSIDDMKADRLRGASRTELSYALSEFLTSLQPLHAFAVVMIDEAQNLPAALLEEIRILSDMENGEKLLQLVLIGQPELQARLSTPEMRQLKQRLTVRCKLDPLARDDVGNYISHRLGIAGNGNVEFAEDAIHLTYEASEGIPRVINLLCDRALFRAASAGATTVSAEHIVGAADDLWIPLAGFGAPLLPGPVAAPSSPTPTEHLALASKRIADYLKKTRNAASRPRASRQGLPSSYQMRHDAHYVEELESRSQSVMSETAAHESAASEPTTEEFGGSGVREFGGSGVRGFGSSAVRAKRWPKLATVAAAALVLSAASVWLLRSSADRVSQSPAFQPARESTTSSLTAPPASIAAPERASSLELSPPAATPLSPVAGSSNAGAPRFAVQMATFRTRARAAESVRELGAAGFDAFGTEVSLQDGGRAFAVFLGPYSDRTAADADLERAQLLPGYGTGWVVQIGLTASGDNWDPSR